jgi:hypothetical protein
MKPLLGRVNYVCICAVLCCVCFVDFGLGMDSWLGNKIRVREAMWIHDHAPFLALAADLFDPTQPTVSLHPTIPVILVNMESLSLRLASGLSTPFLTPHGRRP